MTENNAELITLSIDFDRSIPPQQMECGNGQQMIYGNFDFDFPHRDSDNTRFHIPDVPAWLCPTDCPRFTECKGSLRLLTKSVGDQILKAAAPYYGKTLVK